MRAFNFWLLSECHSVLAGEVGSSEAKDLQDTSAGDGTKNIHASSSPYIKRCQNPNLGPSEAPPFELQSDVYIYMYCTCAPCGDASMELVMAAQDDPTPWTLPNTSTRAESNSEPLDSALLDGRGHFSKLGIVRRKPARADAESTKSKSCSDKLALRQVTSLLNHETSLLVAVTSNAYLKGLILPEEEITRVGCERCFGRSGRMKDLRERTWPVAGVTDGQPESEYPYSFQYRPFDILSIPNTQLKSLWPYRKPRASDPVEKDSTFQPRKSKPGTISAIWVRALTTEHTGQGPNCTAPLVADNGSKNLPALRGSKTGLFESIINGVRQGSKASAPGLRGASALSRARMWEHWSKIKHCIDFNEGGDFGSTGRRGSVPDHEAVDQAEDGTIWDRPTSTYWDFKQSSNMTGCMQARKSAMRAAKEVLGSWVPNSGDEQWGWNLEGLVDSKGVPVGDPAKKRKREVHQLS